MIDGCSFSLSIPSLSFFNFVQFLYLSFTLLGCVCDLILQFSAFFLLYIFWPFVRSFVRSFLRSFVPSFVRTWFNSLLFRNFFSAKFGQQNCPKKSSIRHFRRFLWLKESKSSQYFAESLLTLYFIQRILLTHLLYYGKHHCVADLFFYCFGIKRTSKSRNWSF